MSEHIKVVRDGSVVEIALARPEKRNAITDAMYAALADALDAADAEEQAAVVILHAEGHSFTAGNDLKDFVAIASAGHEHRTMSVGRFLASLTNFTKPLIAVVQGNAVGVGTTLLLHCDLAYADPDAVFSTPFVGLGLTPEGGSSELMPARLGYVRAYAMLALGETLTASAALTAGLVNEVVSEGGALSRAREVARQLAARPPQALAATKRLMRGDQQHVRDLMMAEGAVFYAQAKSTEAQDAFRAFFSRQASR